MATTMPPRPKPAPIVKKAAAEKAVPAKQAAPAKAASPTKAAAAKKSAPVVTKARPKRPTDKGRFAVNGSGEEGRARACRRCGSRCAGSEEGSAGEEGRTSSPECNLRR